MTGIEVGLIATVMELFEMNDDLEGRLGEAERRIHELQMWEVSAVYWMKKASERKLALERLAKTYPNEVANAMMMAGVKDWEGS